MAGRSSYRVVARIGNRLVTQISTRSPATQPVFSLSAPALRRSLNTSVYDKNVEDLVSVVVPDEIIQPQSDKYWGPNPHTGVFGPDSEHNRAVGGERGFHFSPSNGGSESVLEQKAFFRPLEDLDKPQHP